MTVYVRAYVYVTKSNLPFYTHEPDYLNNTIILIYGSRFGYSRGRARSKIDV